MRGIAGSVRSIALHPTLPLMASGALDRFVRVHNVNTRKIVHKVLDTSVCVHTVK